MIVWVDDDGAPRLYHNHPSTVRVFYDAENQRVKTHAVKMWDQAGFVRVDLYFPDRIERYISTKKGDVANSDDTNFEPYFEEGETEQDSVIVNPFGEVPVFHFRTQYPSARPEHADAYELQMILNKWVTGQMSTIDFITFPQRYALLDPTKAAAHQSNDDFADGDDAEPAENLHAGPGVLQVFKNFTNVGTFATGTPDQFQKPMESYLGPAARVGDI